MKTTPTQQKIDRALALVTDGIKIIGDVLIVERLPKRETKSAGGIIWASGDRQTDTFDSNQPEFVRVLAIGAGYYDDETKESVPLEIKPGNIIEVGKVSVNWFSTFGTIMNNPKAGTGIGLTRDTERRIVFENEEVFNAFMDVFYEAETSENTSALKAVSQP